MKKNDLFQLLRLMAIYFISFSACETNDTAMKPDQDLTRDEATRIVLKGILGSDTLNKAIFVFPERLKKSEAVEVSDNPIRSYSVAYESWCLLIDHQYLVVNRPHWCEYVFVKIKDGSYKRFLDTYFPTRFSEMDTAYVWARPQTHAVPPLTFQDMGRGCINMLLYKINIQCTAALVVRADTAKLHLSPDENKEFDLSQNPDGLTVYVDFYDYLPEGNQSIGGHYCNDVVSDHQPPKKWFARQGLVQIKITQPAQDSGGYGATVWLRNIHFIDENGGNEIILDELVFENVHVGWLPG